MEYLLSVISGYLFGSIPTAYLMLKKTSGIDITNTGTGNVGAMNSYEITNSKNIGIIVFFIDFLKGFIPVFILSVLLNCNFTVTSLALIFAVLSHCFNPWINFNGGRGLATAAGGLSILFYPLLVIWILIWIITYLIKKDILLANILAIVLSLLSCFVIYNQLLSFAYPKTASVNELLLFISAGLIIIFIKHIDPLKEILLKRNKS